MSTWPSRGLELHGFEVKSSRADWLRERDNPEKAEAISKYCDRWWLVIGDREIVVDGELPPTWGLLVLEKGKLRTVREAPPREATPIDRRFLAALLRRATEMQARLINPADIANRIKAEVDAKLASLTTDRSYEVRRLKEDSELLKKLEAALGVDVSHEFQIPSVKAAWEVVKSVDSKHRYVDDLRGTVRSLEHAIASARLALAQIEHLRPAKDDAA